MDKKYDITLDVDTLQDFLMVCHQKAISDASAKFCKPVPPRQIGELYPAYHRRIMEHLQQESIQCQQFVEMEDQVARAVGKARFPLDK